MKGRTLPQAPEATFVNDVSIRLKHVAAREEHGKETERKAHDEFSMFLKHQ